MVDIVSPALARRIALAAQGFSRPLPEAPGTRAVNGVIDRLALLQIDSVNVFERSHYLPAFSRWAPTNGPRSTASRPGDADAWSSTGRTRPRTSRASCGRSSSSGARSTAPRAATGAAGSPRTPPWPSGSEPNSPRTARWRASEIEHDSNERRGPWWGWSDVKRTLEMMFRTGDVVCVERRRFERVYALPEQALPGELLGTAPVEADAVRELVALAASAQGIATEADLADYWRMKRAPVRQAITELEEAGVLLPVEVPGGGPGRGRRRPGCTATRSGRAASRRPRCSHRSTLWCGSARAPSGSSTSTTASRSTRPSPSASSGTTRCPCSSTIGGRPGRPEERPAGGRAAGAVGVGRAGAPAETAARLVPVLQRAAAWQGLGEVSVTGGRPLPCARS
ncbi:DNA glycosylase AlkZ-like family protein [Agromyces cerinus subsp. nitratus]|uniref:DNA glycosylase AlkZ-like family protein n=1 Tax=Agromyces cerinus TaxID=33878 RepID=UPI00364298F3